MKNSTKLPGKNGAVSGPKLPFNLSKKQKSNNVTAKNR